MQKEFINIAAHELRTPIQPILGLSEILTRYNHRDSENYKIAEVISRNAIKLQHIAEDILDVTKIESKSLILNKEIFDLDYLISNTIADFEKSPNKKSNDLGNQIKIAYKSKIQLEKNNSPVLVEADKLRISKVLSNLLSNANKAVISTEVKEPKFIYINLSIQKNNYKKSYQLYTLIIITSLVVIKKQKKQNNK